MRACGEHGAWIEYPYPRFFCSGPCQVSRLLFSAMCPGAPGTLHRRRGTDATARPRVKNGWPMNGRLCLRERRYTAKKEFCCRDKLTVALLACISRKSDCKFVSIISWRQQQNLIADYVYRVVCRDIINLQLKWNSLVVVSMRLAERKQFAAWRSNSRCEFKIIFGKQEYFADGSLWENWPQQNALRQQFFFPARRNRRGTRSVEDARSVKCKFTGTARTYSQLFCSSSLSLSGCTWPDREIELAVGVKLAFASPIDVINWPSRRRTSTRFPSSTPIGAPTVRGRRIFGIRQPRPAAIIITRYVV